MMAEKSEEYTYFPDLHALFIHWAYLYTHTRTGVRLAENGFFYNIQQPSEQSRQKLHLVLQNYANCYC